VIGTQNTGKSTFIKDILEKFKGTVMEFKTVGCDYRKKIEERGLKINRNGNLESQKIIFNTLVEQLDIIDGMPNGCYLTDRTPIDAYVYTKYLKEHKPESGITDDDLQSMFNKLCCEVGRYDKIVFLDLDRCGNVVVVDDKFRDTNLEYRREIDWLFKDTLLKLVLSGVLPASKVSDSISGTRDERVGKFIELINAPGIFDAEGDSPIPIYPDPVQTVDKMYEYGYRVTDDYVFFFGSFMSNFARCKFLWTFNGERHEFFCTEQAFMWAKAMYFGDVETAQKILDEDDDPLVCKHLGREVRGYDDEKWNELRYNIMLEVNLARFQQCVYHRKKLLDPEFDGKTFVEASPVDGIWGIKMGIKDEGILNSSNWKGQNLMGKVITDVRKRLMTLQNNDNLV
jgi:ribA/ribD-fused uncharacterized protein